MTKKLLLVQFQALPRQALAEQLRAKGLIVSEDSSPLAARSRLGRESIDLVLIDGDPLDRAVIDFCQGLIGAGVPVVMLVEPPRAGTASGLPAYCVVKPFRFIDLLRRVEGSLALSKEAALRIGGYRLHRPMREMTDATGRKVRLTEKETAILAYLHAAGERPVTREELLGEVWGYSHAVATHTVESHIYRLRRKLAAEIGGAGLLRTESGGYRLGNGT